MRTLRRPTVLLTAIALLGPLGCSSTSSLRTANAPKIRTIAAVGDKTLPAEAGEPGASVAADEYTPERRVDRDGRLSGRVFNDKGKPVPDARVRIGLGGVAGGKIVNTTTDRSGGFTLHGLRPGATYTVIAESKDDDLGALSGSSEAQAPQTDVRITLSPDDNAQPPARASGNVNRVSRPQVDEADEELFESSPREASPAGARSELLPPAPEAESFLPTKGRNSRRPNRSMEAEPPMTARWRRGDAERSSSSTTNRDDATVAPAESEEDFDDDGHNPLPPARDPGASDSGERTSAASSRRRRSESNRDVAHSASGAHVVVPENFTPITLAETPYRGAVLPGAADTRTAAPARPSAAQAPPSVPWYEAPGTTDDGAQPLVAHEESTLVAPDEQSTPEGPRRRAKWGELAGVGAAAPAENRSATPPRHAPSSSEGRPRLVSTPDSGSTKTAAGSTSEPGDGAIAYCRFDAKSRRIVDFRLPDVTGKPVRFQDLDSDLVLIDFWGTWCKPCVAAVPHLAELQSRLGGKRLTVLGIASEQGPPAARTATVSKAVQKLGINYPVLLSGMDGESCPVQEALHIQAFPTLILVDRQGRILWRDQGATPATLARLDHFIASATKPDDTRRY